MKRKNLLIGLLSLAFTATSAFAIAACDNSGAEQEPSQIEQVYAQYVVYAQAEGIEPVSYEAWLATIKGEKGDKGDQGEQGEAGANGQDGESAYQIWLELGNQGTEADFIAWLKGEKGDKGDQGEQGIQGEKGDKGDQGEQGIQGEKGDKGDQGEQGIQGEKGETGVGIEKVEYDENGDLKITFTDGSTQTVAMPDKHVHTFGSWINFTTSQTPCDERVFYRACSDCNEIEWKQGVEDDHSWWTRTTAPTCTAQGYDTKTCWKCGESRKENYTEIVDHDWETEYRSDNTHHWIKCEDCTAIKDKTEHTPDETASLCSVCSEPIGVQYELSTCGTYAIVVDCAQTATSVEILSSYKGVPVTTIGNYAFYGCDSLTSVVIPDSVTSIGSYAFWSCDSLTSVYISDIAAWCDIDFGGYSSNPLYYAKNLYLNNELVTELVIPDTVTEIKAYAFLYCKSLTSVVIPNSVTSIGYEAFWYCTSLTSVVIGDSVTSIGDYAFYYCTSLTSVVIPDSVTSIGGSAFSGCPIETATIPTIAISYIPKSKLKTVVITSGDSIGERAFYECTSLTSIVIPDSVTSIGTNAFHGCSAVEEVRYNGTIEDWCNITFEYSEYGYGYGMVEYVDGDSQPLYGAEKFYLNDELVTNLVIPDTVTEIKAFAFNGYLGLQSVTIGDSVASIGRSAFNSCDNLTSVNLGDSVKRVAIRVFAWCEKLETIIIPNSIEWIGSEAFAGCSSSAYNEYDNAYYLGNENNKYLALIKAKDTSITSCTIHENVQIIVDEAFYGCRKLVEVNNKSSLTITPGSYHNGCAGYYAKNVYTPTSGESKLSTDENGYIIYTDGDLVSLIGYTGTETDLVLPEGITKIYRDAFSGCTSLTSIVIPDSVTSIGYDAFSGCTSLTSIVIPDSVTSIGYDAFSGCTSLTSIVIPDSVTSIGDWAFWGCSSLTSVVIPDSVVAIGMGAFEGCYSLTSVYITDIAAWCNIVFENDTQWWENSNPLWCGADLYLNNELVTELVIPDTVGVIGFGAFYGCTSLTSVVIPDSVIWIEEYAFYDCYKLVEVYNKSSLTITAGSEDYGYVGYYAKNVYTPWSGESKLSTDENGYIIYTDEDLVSLIGYTGTQTDLVLPEGITKIYQGAIYECTSLTSVVIGDSVTSIGNSAFAYCTSLTSVVIGDSVTSIGSSAFNGCYKLVEVYNKSSLTIAAGRWSNGYVGYYAKNVYTPTSGESKLSTDENGYIIYTDGDLVSLIGYTGTQTDLVLPEGITEINRYAFYNCDILTSVVIPDSVTSIGYEAFEGCTSLTSVVIGDSVTSIGDYAFYYCNNLQYNEYDNGYYLGNENNKYIVLVKAKDTTITSCTIHEDTKFIHSQAFYNCTSLTSVVIPDSVTSIGSNAFSSCKSLTSVEIGNSVTSIGSGAFYKCTSLTSVVIPDSVTTIGDEAFRGCTSLTSVVIGSSVTSIGSYAFAGCDNLQYNEYDNGYYLGNENNKYIVLVKAKDRSITSCTIHEDTKFIHSQAFYNCTSLTSVVIPDSVTSIGNYAFYNCTSLTSVYITDIAAWCNIDFGYYSNPLSNGAKLYLNNELVTELVIPDTVTEIKDYTFYYCDSLTSVVIGDSVTSIGSYAFYWCRSLTSVYYKGTAEDWAEISVDWGNTYLTNATRYYYSETEPTTSGNYWHYDENGEIVVW